MIDVDEAAFFEHFGERAGQIAARSVGLMIEKVRVSAKTGPFRDARRWELKARLTVVLQTSKEHACAPNVPPSAALRLP